MASFFQLMLQKRSPISQRKRSKSLRDGPKGKTQPGTTAQISMGPNSRITGREGGEGMRDEMVERIEGEEEE